MNHSRIRMGLALNIASLVLGLAGGACAAYPVLKPFHGHELVDITVDAVTLGKTPEFEKWQETGDTLGRWGLFLVALGTVTAAVAQVTEAIARSRSKTAS